MACYNGAVYRLAKERGVMATHNTTALHYLELLNHIASGERRAGVFLQAWADTTPDPELRACLSMVANRETSHYHIFKRRVEELGYSWTENQDPDFDERLKVSSSDMPDVEKIWEVFQSCGWHVR
jgi:rubrerythrin